MLVMLPMLLPFPRRSVLMTPILNSSLASQDVSICQFWRVRASCIRLVRTCLGLQWRSCWWAALMAGEEDGEEDDLEAENWLRIISLPCSLNINTAGYHITGDTSLQSPVHLISWRLKWTSTYRSFQQLTLHRISELHQPWNYSELLRSSLLILILFLLEVKSGFIPPCTLKAVIRLLIKAL